MAYVGLVAHGRAMSTTPPDTQQPQAPGPDSGPRVGWDDIRDLGRIRRNVADRRVSGVAAGLGRHLDIDPLIVRVAFVVLTFFGGVGLVLYVACWLLVPEDGSDWAKIKLDRRSRVVALVIVGAFCVLLLISHGWWGNGGVIFVCLAVVLAAVVISTQLPGRGDRSDVPPPGEPNPYAVTDPDAPTTGTTYAPPPPVEIQPRPVNPRKRGPILSGVFLLIGAVWGRAGGLILVGLVAALATAGTTVSDQWHPRREVVRPVTSATLQSDYRVDVGELVVDLTQVTDPTSLDGRTIHVSGGVGHLDIRVPANVTVLVDAHVSGPGGINLFGQDDGGVDTMTSAVHTGRPDAPHLTIDAELHVGAIDVHTGSGR